MRKMNVPSLTPDQRKWVTEKLDDYNCIYVGIHGSNLYGLDRPESDIDIKAIFLPSKEDLILGKALKTKNFKNDTLDIEIEVKSISEFLKSSSVCDTNCVDLLHSPDEAALYETGLWRKIKSYRKGLYAKNMKGIIGYIKTHSKKYTNKIDRLEEMLALLSICEDIKIAGYKLVKDVAESSELIDKKFKFIKSITLVKDHEQQYLEVCGKKYIFTWSVTELISALKNEISRYGKRSNEGMEKGLDTKSLSHAIRVLYQLREILLTNDLKFPLEHSEYVLKVKKGEVTDVTEVMDKIDSLYEECTTLLEESDLPEEVDIKQMYDVVVDYYFNQ